MDLCGLCVCACVYAVVLRVYVSALAPAGWDVSPLCLVTANMNLSIQAWSCDRSADSPAPSRLCSQHPFIPATYLARLILN